MRSARTRLPHLLLGSILVGGTATGQSPPVDDPAAKYGLSWTASLPWKQVVDIRKFEKATWEESLEAAQDALVAQGGGGVFFPAGTYRFSQNLKLRHGIVLRGAEPQGTTDARRDGFDPPTRFEFPRYVPKFSGNGTPNDTAFKGIYLADPARASNCGLVHLSINRGHIAFGEAEDRTCGRNRLVVGCVLRNAAVADSAIPSAKIGQHPWQRFNARHHAAIHVKAAENALIANNRLPFSGDDDFVQKGYVLSEPRTRKPFAVEEGVVFDFDNRPGIYANDYGLGAGGGNGPAGTPATHPWGFRKGLVITGNFLQQTGRCAIAFSGDGVQCTHNVIRFKPGVNRWTTTGLVGVTGSGTNDNRAVQMRGYRWTVADNDYEVHRNRAMFGKYLINDGEGLMHEAHVNTAIVDSKLLNNRGNAYLSLYKVHGIDGLLIRGNTIRTPGGIDAIYVNTNYNGKYFPIRDVLIEKNVTAGTGIRVEGRPAANVVVRDNRHDGAEPARIRNLCGAQVEGNRNYEVVTTTK